METLSYPQARKIALLSQGLPTGRFSGLTGTLAAIRHLGYVQIDSISVVSRAHHHTLWSRVRNYKPEYIDKLLKKQQIFEYWSHAAAYLPMEDYRFSLPGKARIREHRHWFERDQKVEQEVLSRIRNEGPLQAKDFEKPQGHEGGWWQWKPAKQSLEQLFMAGELMCPYRAGFQKVYDLTERVLPEQTDRTMPTEQEMAGHLIRQNLRAHGLIQAGEAAYQRKNILSPIKKELAALEEQGELLRVQVGKHSYYTSEAQLALLEKPLARKRVKILSPFDNLVIQRKRLQELFDFDYRIECYVPADKRQYGYYALPVLWQGQFVARLDARADRKQGIFHISKLVMENRFNKNREDFARALKSELAAYARFNQCHSFIVEETQPQSMKSLLINQLQRE